MTAARTGPAGAALILGLLAPLPGQARVASIPLAELTRRADFIAEVHVDAIETFDGLRVARAVPTTVLKGDPAPRTVYFVAEPTWKCDTSTGAVGSPALVFLTRAKTDRVTRRGKPTARVTARPLYLIAHSGRGLLPITIARGEQVVQRAAPGLLFPRTLRDMPGVPGLCRLADVETLIRHAGNL